MNSAELKTIGEQIERLVLLKYPLLSSIQQPISRRGLASRNNFIATGFDASEYAKKADAMRKELWDVAFTNLGMFQALVRDADFRSQGPFLTLTESAKFIGDTLYPDDGYPSTAVQREQCGATYRHVLQTLILTGRVKFFNPHTRLPFDPERLTHDRLPDDGLLRVAQLHACLQPRDQKYANRFPEASTRVSFILEGFPSSAPVLAAPVLVLPRPVDVEQIEQHGPAQAPASSQDDPIAPEDQADKKTTKVETNLRLLGDPLVYANGIAKRMRDKGQVEPRGKYKGKVSAAKIYEEMYMDICRKHKSLRAKDPSLPFEPEGISPSSIKQYLKKLDFNPNT